MMAEFLTGNPKRNAYGESHEVDLWSEFQRDMHGHDYAGWLYGARKAAIRDFDEFLASSGYQGGR